MPRLTYLPSTVKMSSVRDRFDARCRRLRTQMWLAFALATVGITAWMVLGNPTVSDLVIGATGIATVLATLHVLQLSIHQAEYASETQEALADRERQERADVLLREELDKALREQLNAESWQVALSYLPADDADHIVRALGWTLEDVARLFPRMQPKVSAWRENQRRASLTDDELAEEYHEERAADYELEQSLADMDDPYADPPPPTRSQRWAERRRKIAESIRRTLWPRLPSLRDSF